MIITFTSWILLTLGIIITTFNFYLSLLRQPLNNLCGKQEFRYISPIPLVGSILVLLAILLNHEHQFLIIGTIAMLLDTGGFHWLLITLVWLIIENRKQKP